MENWQTIFPGLKQLPRELSAFEIEAFFTFSEAERATIAARRRPALQLGLALQIGFLRMSGRLLDALRIVPPALWRHLGAQLSCSFMLRSRFKEMILKIFIMNLLFVILRSINKNAIDLHGVLYDKVPTL